MKTDPVSAGVSIRYALNLGMVFAALAQPFIPHAWTVADPFLASLFQTAPSSLYFPLLLFSKRSGLSSFLGSRG